LFIVSNVDDAFLQMTLKNYRETQ